MSLPAIFSLHDATDYALTVAPYLTQLSDLPHKIVAVISSPKGLVELYLSTNPLVAATAFSLFIVPILYVAQEVNKNYSQVDRVWSILPAVYNVHYAVYAHLADLPTRQADALAAVSVLWSMRLTYNYWRKGGYTIGSEDYRWETVQKLIGPISWALLSLFFIALYQSILLLSVTFPSYILLLSSTVPSSTFTLSDTLFPTLILSLVTLTYVADQQQWNYQTAKSIYRSTSEAPSGWSATSLKRGFRTEGLFAYSRHPNFLFEQSVWVTVYVWSCVRTGTLWNWSVAGPLIYTSLFQGSTRLTEAITAHKYPKYEWYQKDVGMFFPGLFYGKPVPGWIQRAIGRAMDMGEEEEKKKK